MLTDRYKKLMVSVFDDWCKILQVLVSLWPEFPNDVQKARLKYFYSYASSAAKDLVMCVRVG